MNPNGDVLQLAAGAYRATVAAAGATLAALTHAGRDLVLPFDPLASIGRAYQGRTLVPWPNRIAGGAYDWSGQPYEVPVNEHRTGAALHGLGSWQRWAVTDCDGWRVRLALDLPASPGYPFELALAVTYALDESGLTATIRATNTGRTSAPYGASSHPFLTCGGPVDECTLVVPASHVLKTDASLIPTGVREVEGSDFDLRRPEPLGARVIDHAYQGLPEGAWTVTLTRDGHGVALESDARWVQVYTGELVDRVGVAVEPMTCPPDAFNQAPETVRLLPGASTDLTFSIRAL